MTWFNKFLMKRLNKSFLFVVLLAATSAFGQTTASVTANLKQMFGTAEQGTAQVCVTLAYPNSTTFPAPPRVAGTGVILPLATQCQSPNSSGVVTFNLYGNDVIAVGGQTAVTYYVVEFYVDGQEVSGANYVINTTDSPVDLSVKAPLNNIGPIPTVAPTDAIYARKDGGNMPFTGPVTAPSVTATGALSGASASITGAVTAGSAAVTGSIVQTAGGAAELDINHSIFATSPNGVFPLGGDINIECRGSSDCIMQHIAAKATASSTLNIGANSNVLVANISPTSSLLTSFTGCTNAGLTVGRGTPNEETVNSPNCTIVDATHITLTLAKTHTVNGADNNNKSLIDIEQGVGHTVLQMDGGGALEITNVSPSQEPAATHEMVRIAGDDGVPYLLLPDNQGDTFPRNAVAFNAPITGTGTIGAGGGQLPSAADLKLRNSSASNSVLLLSSTGTNSFIASDTLLTFALPFVDATAGGTAAQSGTIRMLNAHAISWRSSAATDLNFGVNGADGLSFDSAHVPGATVPYVLGVANLTAQSTAVGPTTIRAVAANQAGMFRISWSAVVTQAATTSSTLGGANVGFQVVYTDNDTGAAVTTPLAAAPGAGTNTAYSQTNSQNTVGSQASGVVIVNAKASTNIQYQFGYTSVGGTVMQYALHVRVEPI